MHNRMGARASFAALWRAHPAILSGLLALLAANALLPLAYRIHPLARVLDYLSVFILAFWAAGFAWRRSRSEGPAFRPPGPGCSARWPTLRTDLFRPLPCGAHGPGHLDPVPDRPRGGFLLWPQQGANAPDRVRTFLDGIAIATSLFTLAWMATSSMASVGHLSRGMLLFC
ncbi:MAG: hypothetical protein IPO28_15555 [Holophagaceae bacterium]|nr:hypothetical protein [Holophagaceae bacterium]